MVTALMSLHHVADAPAVLAELVRVLRPGGFLVLREHDCAWPRLAVSLDVVHALYALVWARPVEWPAFVTEYYALYRPRAEWVALCCAAGLARVDHHPHQAPAFPHAAALFDLCLANGPGPEQLGPEPPEQGPGRPRDGDGRAGAGQARSEHPRYRRPDDSRHRGGGTAAAATVSPLASKNPQRFWYGLFRKSAE